MDNVHNVCTCVAMTYISVSARMRAMRRDMRAAITSDMHRGPHSRNSESLAGDGNAWKCGAMLSKENNFANPVPFYMATNSSSRTWMRLPKHRRIIKSGLKFFSSLLVYNLERLKMVLTKRERERERERERFHDLCSFVEYEGFAMSIGTKRFQRNKVGERWQKLFTGIRRVLGNRGIMILKSYGSGTCPLYNS